VSSSQAVPMWLFRAPNSKDGWCAFRQSDQAKISAALLEEEAIVRGGRWKVNVSKREMVPRYWQGSAVPVRRCLWCWREGKVQRVWCPLGTEDDETTVEEEYCRFLGLKAADGKLPPDIELNFPSVSLVLSMGADGSVVASKKKEGWSLRLLQTVYRRGWGGEVERDDEVDEKPSSHLVLIVHGVGEGLFSRQSTSWPSLIDGIDTARAVAREYIPADSLTKVEVLPIEWHHVCQERKKKMVPATLTTAPMLRDFANEIVFDGLLFATDHWRNVIQSTVAEKMNETVRLFAKSNPGWSPENVTVLGHSLGGVILFELLTRPSLLDSQVLNFTPLNFLALGSPIAAFGNAMYENDGWLNLRLEAMRIQKNGVFQNIYNPNDPVAYRMEPMLGPCPHEINKGFEGDAISLPAVEIASSMPVKSSPVKSAGQTKISPAKGTPSEQSSEVLATSDTTEKAYVAPLYCPVCHGNRIPQFSSPCAQAPNCGQTVDHRIDFVLQASTRYRVTEYLFSVRAHTSYFEERDVLKHIIGLVLKRSYMQKALSVKDQVSADATNTLVHS
jgi:hypothetical protein